MHYCSKSKSYLASKSHKMSHFHFVRNLHNLYVGCNVDFWRDNVMENETIYVTI